jgi:hypothetical protein
VWGEKRARLSLVMEVVGEGGVWTVKVVGEEGCGERSGAGTTRVGLSLAMVMVGESSGEEGGGKRRGVREKRIRLSLVVGMLVEGWRVWGEKGEG